MDALEERLRERFEAGLVCDVAPADRATRLTILRKRVDQDDVGDVDPDPHLFLLHLIEALGTALPGIEVHARQRLTHGERAPRLWSAVLDRLSNELLDRLATDTILVLDDYDNVNRPEINAIVERLKIEWLPVPALS